MKPIISVIIPSGRSDLVLFTVEGLINQTLDRYQYEIIIVTPELKKFNKFKAEGIHIVGVNKLHPPGKMRNIGVNKAQGDFVFFIDDDCIPSPGWISKTLKVLKGDKHIGAVGCRVISNSGDFWNRCADYCLFASYQYQQRFICDLGSAAIAVRRAAFKEVNGFDDDLFASEDLDFSLKLTEKGWLCVFEPRVEVKHDHRCNILAIIIVKAYRFGLYSGLVVQARHIKNISWLARISVQLQNPLLYPILIIPYALAVTLHQLWKFRGTEPRLILFVPFMILSRFAYQIGVWVNICKQNYS